MISTFFRIGIRFLLAASLFSVMVFTISCGGGESSGGSEQTSLQPTPLLPPQLANPAPVPPPASMEDIRPLSPEDILADLSPEEQARTELNALGIALIAFRCHVGRYPSQEEGLNALLEPPADEQIPADWRGPYSDQILITDPWGNTYEYNWLDGQDVLFTLRTPGPDGVESDDDIGLTDLKRSAGFAQRAFVDDFIKMFESQEDIFNK